MSRVEREERKKVRAAVSVLLAEEMLCVHETTLSVQTACSSACVSVVSGGFPHTNLSFLLSSFLVLLHYWCAVLLMPPTTLMWWL